MRPYVPNEDAYWEAVRERMENPRRPPDWEPEPESDCLYLDDELDDIEAEYGCKLTELREVDIMGILDRFLKDGREWLSAVWDEAMCGIQYTYAAFAED